jgi:hypothetical protein
MSSRVWLLVASTAMVVLSSGFIGCGGGSGGGTADQPAGVVEPRTADDPTPGLKSEGKLPEQYRK